MKLLGINMPTIWPIRHPFRFVVFFVLALVMVTGAWTVFKPLPAGVDVSGDWHALPEVHFLRDITYLDESEQRRYDHQIMDAMFDMIGEAETFLILDQFLFNAFAGEEGAIKRPLSHELTDTIVARMEENPDLSTWFITDPINTLYGGVVSPQLERLHASGVTVIQTRLTALRDSNPTHAVWWRLLWRHYPVDWGPHLPNPLGPGRVPLRSYLDLLNFKANHRKTMVLDRGGELWGMISSANPHDASSAHDNVAVIFNGKGVGDLLETERAVATFSGESIPAWSEEHVADHASREAGDMRGRILTERAVERAALELLDDSEPGDQVMLAMFYLSSRPIVRGLQRAHERGVKVRVLLDPNKDAFGREKNGVPNRPVGVQLHRAGISVRWARTHGEQFHTKMIARLGRDGEATAIIGSSNYTRRNLRNLNLETCIEVRGPASDPFFQDVLAYLTQVWTNRGGRIVSTGFDAFDDVPAWHHALYWFQEVTGMSTF